MKIKSLSATAILFLIPALAFAGQRNAASVDLDQSVKVSDTQLAPGQYKLTWEGNGPNITVNFTQGKKTVATATAKVVSDPSSQPGAIDTDTTADKTVILQGIELKNETIQFENAASGAGN
jgi:hypothetical protein